LHPAIGKFIEGRQIWFSGQNNVKLERFAELEQKIQAVVEQHTMLKRDKEKVEARLAYKTRESEDIKEQLDKILKDRDVIKKRLDSLIEKLDFLESA